MTPTDTIWSKKSVHSWECVAKSTEISTTVSWDCLLFCPTWNCKIFRNWSLNAFWKLFCAVCLLAFYLISAPSSALEHALVRMSIIITNNELDDSWSLCLQSQTFRTKIKISIIWMSDIMWTMLKPKERAANDRTLGTRHRVGEDIIT